MYWWRGLRLELLLLLLSIVYVLTVLVDACHLGPRDCAREDAGLLQYTPSLILAIWPQKSDTEEVRLLGCQ